MKTRFALFLSLFIALILVASLLVFLQQPASDSIQFELMSNPYPMTVGPMEFTVGLKDAAGEPIENAYVEVTTQLKRPGSPAILNYANHTENGQYRASITWQMMGQGVVTVSAQLPEWEDPVQRQFLVYVYLVPPVSARPERGYRDLTALNEELAVHAEREYWVYIPQGAQEMIMMSEIYAFVPNQIKLHLSGQNTIVIRNDDFIDHTVGPFFIRAGETIRQTFTQATTLQGTCTISHGSAITIVVEE